MDQCKTCLCKGNLAKCEQTQCSWHELWYVGELKARLATAERLAQHHADEHKTANALYREERERADGLSAEVRRLRADRDLQREQVEHLCGAILTICGTDGAAPIFRRCKETRDALRETDHAND